MLTERRHNVKFSENTIKILKSFADINKSIVFRPGNQIKVCAPTKKTIAHAEVEETFEHTFGIFELPRFLTALSLFNEPEVVIHDSYAVITEGERTLKYAFAHVDSIVTTTRG